MTKLSTVSFNFIGIIEWKVESGERKGKGETDGRIVLSTRFICVIARYTVYAKRIVNGTRSNRVHQHGRGCKLLRQYTARHANNVAEYHWTFASREYIALFIFPGGSVQRVRIAMILILYSPLSFYVDSENAI